MKKMFLATLCAFSLACASTAADKASEAIVTLLNSRASGSRSEFREAAKIVAAGAKEGRPLQQFVIALVANDKDLPRKLRLKPETRREYLDQARDKIRRLAEEKNNALAWYLLSLEKNDMSFLKRAADGDNVQALNAWGTITLTNAFRDPSVDTNEVARTLVKCFGLFKKAADKGDANGLYNLGMCHLRGLGTPQDDQSAFNCFRSAAEKEHPEAINNIGLFFREGRVVEKDLEMSTKWFEKSASYDNAYGQFNFALALQNGEGVAQDEARAAGLLAKSADGGCVEAIDAYGVALWKGRGVPENPEAAFKYFLRAAEAGYPPAMENLSTCYRFGKGVKADERRSMEWKIRSRAARGDRNAQAWLQQNAKMK